MAFLEDKVTYYLRHPAYRDYPVVGVSWLQANDFCKWRTDRVNEFVLIREGLLEQNANQQNEPFTTDAYFPFFPLITIDTLGVEGIAVAVVKRGTSATTASAATSIWKDAGGIFVWVAVIARTATAAAILALGCIENTARAVKPCTPTMIGTGGLGCEVCVATAGVGVEVAIGHIGALFTPRR